MKAAIELLENRVSNQVEDIKNLNLELAQYDARYNEIDTSLT